MSAIAFRAEVTADEDEMSNFAQSVWENISDTVDEKIADDAWDTVSSQVSDLIGDEAWDAVSDNVYDAVAEYGNNSDGVEETVSELLRTYNDINVGSHCTIGERATELVTKVIQWHLDTSFEDGGLLSSQTVMNPDEVAYVELEAKVAGLAEENALLWNKVNDLTSMVSRLQATTAGLRAKHDTPEGTLAYAESTLKHILMAVQDKREAVRIAEPF